MEIEFKKTKGRYDLLPEERVLKLLKKDKELSWTSLARNAHIQYNALKEVLDRLQSEGKVVLIQTNYKASNGDIEWSRMARFKEGK